MSTLCRSAEFKPIFTFVVPYVGVGKPFETVTVIKRYTNKLGAEQTGSEKKGSS